MIFGDGIYVKGLNNVLKNLNREIRRIKKKAKGGLIKAGFRIKRESQLRCPVDLGNLRASHDVVWRGTGPILSIPGDIKDAGMKQDHEAMKQETKADLDDMEVAVVVSAYYALYVHEMLVSKSGKPIRHSVGEAKFLEKAINDNQDEIVDLVRREAE